jgi:uncharacterized protein with FMN-binding domain
MLSHAKEHESLAGKLLLSTALIAVTAAYGWWQAGVASQQQAAAMAAMQAAMLAASDPAPAQPQSPAQAQTQAMTAAPESGSVANPGAEAGAPAAESSAQAPAASDTSKMAMASPPASAAPSQNNVQPAAPAAAAAAPAPANGGLLPADPPKQPPVMPLTGMAAIQAFIPTAGISPPLPPVSGVPDAGAIPAIPAGGSRLEDGDYTSDRVQFEWGDLRVRIVVTGGKITTVQIMSYPDHRSQSLYLIQLADPYLTREVIKTQQSQVHVVSTATNTSVAFRDAVAGAIIKATR